MPEQKLNTVFLDVQFKRFFYLLFSHACTDTGSGNWARETAFASWSDGGGPSWLLWDNSPHLVNCTGRPVTS